MLEATAALRKDMRRNEINMEKRRSHHRNREKPGKKV
jgi:hypothetical protein